MSESVCRPPKVDSNPNIEHAGSSTVWNETVVRRSRQHHSIGRVAKSGDVAK
jgi:hypothetical protein